MSFELNKSGLSSKFISLHFLFSLYLTTLQHSVSYDQCYKRALNHTFPAYDLRLINQFYQHPGSIEVNHQSKNIVICDQPRPCIRNIIFDKSYELVHKTLATYNHYSIPIFVIPVFLYNRLRLQHHAKNAYYPQGQLPQL